jgi:hypothetical protein
MQSYACVDTHVLWLSYFWYKLMILLWALLGEGASCLAYA